MTPVAQLVSAEEYLARETKPASEYEDGVVAQKPMPTWKHGLVQQLVCQWINQQAATLRAASEITVRLRPDKYLVPDVVAQSKDHIQDPYPTEAVALCVEILSPADLFADALTKCDAYHVWGVEVTWILDPEEQRAWLYRKGHRPEEVPAHGQLTAPGVALPVAQLFDGI